MNLRYSTLDVFTDRPFGGNPLAVFCDQPELPDAVMQKIAREFNLSETVFIVPPRDPRALRGLRIFTPARELPFAGHPTIGAVHTLVESGIAKVDGATSEFAVECQLGLVPIKVQRRGERPPFLQFTTSRLPELGTEPVPTRVQLAQLLSLNESDILIDRDSTQAWSCGVPFLFIPVRDRAALGRAAPDTAAWRQILKNAWAGQAFAFCRDPELPDSDLRARMFAPEFGIVEDPATGIAAATFAGYLATREARQTGTLRWIVEQGFEMGRPSLLHVEADVADGLVVAVRVGGTAVRMSEGTLTVP
jgi:trans-2,3-dihydro-3-hydroxyanthranilate isomerase